MTNEQRMTGLVDTRKLHNFKKAARALYLDLAEGEDEFEPIDIRNFISRELRDTTLWAESEAARPKDEVIKPLPPDTHTTQI